VQGADAPRTLCAGIRYFNARKPDVIIIGRGGGSIEDLWCFNDENLAREIAASNVPVISAVGHEIDYTICDFVADLRAPTPSAAAELAVPDKLELKGELLSYKQHLYAIAKNILLKERSKLSAIEQRDVMRNPVVKINENRKELAFISDRIESLTESTLKDSRNKLAALAGKMDALSPLRVVSRGYALVENNGKIVKSTSDVSINDELLLKISDGTVVAGVLEVRED
jgi:exodeoxyribonuclease VII large subunit